MKPGILSICAPQIRDTYRPKESRSGEKVFVSVLAGTTIETLEQVKGFSLNLFVII